MQLKTFVIASGMGTGKEELLRGDIEVLLRYFQEEKVPGNGVLVFEESEDIWLQVAFRGGTVHRVVYSRDSQANHWAEVAGLSREQLVPSIRGFSLGTDEPLRALLTFTERKKPRRFSQEEIDRAFGPSKPWWKVW